MTGPLHVCVSCGGTNIHEYSAAELECKELRTQIQHLIIRIATLESKWDEFFLRKRTLEETLP